MKSNLLQLASALATDLENEFASDFVGLIVGGSAAYGTLYAKSDLDLVCLINKAKRQRRNFVRDSIPIELLIRPSKNFELQFNDTELPEMLLIFAKGQIIKDPRGRIKELQDQALKIWNTGRPAQNLTYPYGNKLRHVPYDLLDDAEDLLSHDAEAAIYVMQHALHVVIDIFYRLNRFWVVKPKRTLEDLREHAPQFAEKVSVFLKHTTDAHTKFKLLSALVEETLVPLGGRALEWSSPWEELGPDGRWRQGKHS